MTGSAGATCHSLPELPNAIACILIAAHKGQLNRKASMAEYLVCYFLISLRCCPCCCFLLLMVLLMVLLVLVWLALLLLDCACSGCELPGASLGQQCSGENPSRPHPCLSAGVLFEGRTCCLLAQFLRCRNSSSHGCLCDHPSAHLCVQPPSPLLWGNEGVSWPTPADPDSSMVSHQTTLWLGPGVTPQASLHCMCAAPLSWVLPTPDLSRGAAHS